ncbi:MAG: FAD-binding oxidoreductase [Gordonia sp. (in: high G+C Gram-positive bacteria)]
MTAPGTSVLYRVRMLIREDPDRFGRAVFARLFGHAPASRDMFPAQMAHLRVAFVQVIDHVLEAVPAPDGHTELVEFLAQLGRDHRKYGVTPAHYDLMYSALVAEMSAMLGPEWTRDAAAAVSQAMQLTTGVMRGAAQSAEEPATWRAQVVQKFNITRERVVVRLRAIDPPPAYNAGQYFEVRIPQWPNLWRYLSPSIPPNDNGELEFHVRAVPGGQVSTSIVRETVAGDVWTFAQTHGTLQVDMDRPVLMVAGGTGLSPLRALLVDMAPNVDAPPTHLFVGTRYPGELYELGSLRQLATSCPWLTVTAVSEETQDPWWIDGSADPRRWGFRVLHGQVGDVVAADRDWSGHQVLISGPADMISSTTLKLRLAGVPLDSIESDPVY